MKDSLPLSPSLQSGKKDEDHPFGSFKRVAKENVEYKAYHLSRMSYKKPNFDTLTSISKLIAGLVIG